MPVSHVHIDRCQLRKFHMRVSQFNPIRSGASQIFPSLSAEPATGPAFPPRPNPANPPLFQTILNEIPTKYPPSQQNSHRLDITLPRNGQPKTHHFPDHQTQLLFTAKLEPLHFLSDCKLFAHRDFGSDIQLRAK